MSSNTLLNGPELRMRTSWRFEVASPCVWTGRRTCWRTVCWLLFSPRKLTYIQNCISKSLVWTYSGKDGERPSDIGGACEPAGAARRCAATGSQLVEIWKKQKFFSSTTSTFELSDSIVAWCRGLAQTWGRSGTKLLSPNRALGLEIPSEF